MTIATVLVYDAIRINAGQLPRGHAAGYTTGSGIVPWGDAEWRAHPGAVRICQDPGASDKTADVLDVENQAATIADCAPWAEAAASNYARGTRPGQRSPAIYCNMSSLTGVVNALVAGKIASGVGLWVANWNLTEAQARAIVESASGPWPVIGVQYRNAGNYDVSVFSVPWLQSGGGPAPSPAPPANWTEMIMQALPTLARGASGEDVKTLQGCLIARGFTVTADGSFGPKTDGALRAFQSAAGFTGNDVNGKTDPKTWPKLLNR